MTDEEVKDFMENHGCTLFVLGVAMSVMLAVMLTLLILEWMGKL